MSIQVIRGYSETIGLLQIFHLRICFLCERVMEMSLVVVVNCFSILIVLVVVIVVVVNCFSILIVLVVVIVLKSILTFVFQLRPGPRAIYIYRGRHLSLSLPFYLHFYSTHLHILDVPSVCYRCICTSK